MKAKKQSGIGAELRELRLAANLRQSDVALAMGVLRVRVTAIERTKHVRPGTTARFRAAVAASAEARERLSAALIKAVGAESDLDFANRKIVRR